MKTTLVLTTSGSKPLVTDTQGTNLTIAPLRPQTELAQEQTDGSP